MKKRIPIFFVVLIAILTATPKSKAQEQRPDTSDFDRRVESTVNEIFRRFDEQYGTYIFTDEPSPRTEQSESEEPCDSSSAKHRREQHRWFGDGQSSFFASTPENFIHRNSTILYPWFPVGDDILFRYNRVEGLFLGLNSPKQYHWEGRHINVFGSAGYGFAFHRWRYGGGIANQFGRENRIFEVGVEGHSLTDTPDQWIVGDEENNLAALLLRDDYRDYYSRDGASLWTALYLRSGCTDAQIRAAYLIDSYGSLDRSTNWSLFGGDKVFRDNPPVNDGDMRSMLVSIDAHNSARQRYMITGWSAVASAEFGGKAFHGDFDFNRYIVDIRRYQPLSDYDNINIRLRASSLTGDMVLQKMFGLGGFSTLPAFAFKEFNGNRMLLANAEYVVNGKLFDDSGIPAWILRNFNVILFCDAGYVAMAQTGDALLNGFNNLGSSTIKSDWGLGFGTRDGKMRLGFAWRTDVAEPVRVFLRIDRPF